MTTCFVEMTSDPIIDLINEKVSFDEMKEEIKRDNEEELKGNGEDQIMNDVHGFSPPRNSEDLLLNQVM